MKRFKSSKAYGAFEYAVIITLTIIVALMILNIVRGKSQGSISYLDSATSAVENVIGFESGGEDGDGSVPEETSSITVTYTQSFDYDYEDELGVAVQNYFTNHAIVRKDGEVVSSENYDLSGIARVGNYVQVDIEVDEDAKREQIAINEICRLATDSDFSGTTNGNFKYIGTAKCVEIPHIIKGVNVTSYESMFTSKDVKKVISTNSNVSNMSYMFSSSQSTHLDLSNLDTGNVIYMIGMFNNSRSTSIDLSNFNTLNVTHMRTMFMSSRAISLDLSSFDTSNVTDMESMFLSCHATTLDLSSFNTSNVTNMSFMFYQSQATSLDLSSFDTSKVTNMYYMFNESKAMSINLSSFDTSNVIDMGAMFSNSQATSLDLSSFDFTKANVSAMLMSVQTTEVLVKDGASQNKLNLASNKPAYTEVKIK